MRAAHFDCFSGISGDMTLAALLDAGVDAQAVRQGLASLGLPIQLEIEQVRKCGIAATYVRIEAPEETEHRFLPEIEEILRRGSALTDRQRDLALRIFRRLAKAEAAVHGVPVDRVHFHEVGALDSIADIVGAAIGLDLLGVEHFTSRPVPTGSGMVKCAHGLMPIPAPATALLLRGAPLAASDIKAELTTPTGAAILTTVVSEWVETPRLALLERVAHGAGTKNFPDQPNVLRVFVGQVSKPAGRLAGLESCPTDTVWVLETNLDDLPAEVIGYCYDLLFAAGALDVFTTAIQMKKNRPGVLLSVLVAENRMEDVEAILFRETTTLGIRRYPVSRHILNRKPHTVSTPWGPVDGKLAWREGRPPTFSPEYDACARIAREHGVALREVYAKALQAYESATDETRMKHG